MTTRVRAFRLHGGGEVSFVSSTKVSAALALERLAVHLTRRGEAPCGHGSLCNAALVLVAAAPPARGLGAVHAALRAEAHLAAGAPVESDLRHAFVEGRRARMA